MFSRQIGFEEGSVTLMFIKLCQQASQSMTLVLEGHLLYSLVCILNMGTSDCYWSYDIFFLSNNQMKKAIFCLL